MTVSSADYTTVVQRCRDALNRGGDLRGPDLMLVIDVVQDAANTIDTQAAARIATVSADAIALEAELVTQMALWDAAGAGDSSAVYATALAALADLRTDLVTSAAAALEGAGSVGAVTDIATHPLDGRNA